MATADLTVLGLGRAEASASAYVAEIQRRLAAQDRVRYRMHAMGTSLEGATADILAVVAELHRVPLDLGLPRAYSVLKLDERTDKPGQTLDDKVASVRALLESEDGYGAEVPSPARPDHPDADDGGAGHADGAFGGHDHPAPAEPPTVAEAQALDAPAGDLRAGDEYVGGVVRATRLGVVVARDAGASAFVPVDDLHGEPPSVGATLAVRVVGVDARGHARAAPTG
ncbi:MTH1187 family thiamine-binding protein [Patulibacter sp. SYSU D01012]|uniref:MTH1187 family thiamine-binding protein n=1 Tax=Patulibacter sp. SYSU D01012 TaxID=2817381 RepID=UPI001FEF72E2|nr:MTH1187 family thiamine-binding protein [Patulibacter sp. SYSU D01012]